MPRRLADTLDVEKSPLLLSTLPNAPLITISGPSEYPTKGIPEVIRDAVSPRRPSAPAANERPQELPMSPREVYSLSNDGKIGVGDPEWRARLRSAVLSDDFDLTEALLCCGVLVTKDFLDEIPAGHEEVEKLCSKFYPDIWTAVQTGNVKQVRCLVNLWHKVNVTKDGRMLFQLAIQHSNPFIISLIGGIQATMDVAHSVLAGDLSRLIGARANGQYIKRTLKHFGHNCAPILYFAIIQNRSDLVEELCVHFCSKGDDEMLDEEENEVPLLFVALQHEVDLQIIEHLLRYVGRAVHAVWYGGKNILQYALDIRVSLLCFEVLLQFGGARLIADRDLANRTVFDLCQENDSADSAKVYTAALESQIKLWVDVRSPELGWLASFGLNIPTRCDWWWCIEEVSQLQENIENLDHCIDVNDIEWFYELMKSTVTRHEWPDAIWHGRHPGSGQTLLHRAVIRNRKEIVELIVIHANITDVPLDNFGASALHYACASAKYSELEQLLLCLGFGEHYVDKSGHDCASYRVRRDKPEMLQFLEVLGQGNCTRAALITPWSTDSDDTKEYDNKKEIISRSTLSLAPGLTRDKTCPQYRSAEVFRRGSNGKDFPPEELLWSASEFSGREHELQDENISREEWAIPVFVDCNGPMFDSFVRGRGSWLGL